MSPATMRAEIRTPKGFTLIELLLGLTLFSIVALSLYGTFASGIEINKRFDRFGAIYREARWSFGQFTKDIENMVPYDFSDSYPDIVAFSGDQSHLQLLLADESGLAVIGYELRKANEGEIYRTIVGGTSKQGESITARMEETTDLRALVRTRRSLVDFLSETEREDKEILSTTIMDGSLEFRYADWDAEDDRKIIWEEEWEKKYFPVGVKIRMTFKDEKSGEKVTLERDVFVPRRFRARFET